jgi:hypothetical protein
MDKGEFKTMLDDAEHPDRVQRACEVIFRAYLEHGTAKRAAPLLGCTPAELSRIIATCPLARAARDRAMRERLKEEMHALRQRLGVPELEEKAPVPAPVPAPRRRRGAGGPPLTMALTLDVVPHVPPDDGDGSVSDP